MADWIFLDNHTRTKPSQKLIEQMARECRDHWMAAPIQKIKDKISALLGKGFFYLTSGASENTFHVLFSHYMGSMCTTGRTHVLALETEYPTIADEIKKLEAFDVHGKMLAVNTQGQLSAKALQEAIRPRSSILSLSWAHPLTGVIQPIHDIISVCRQNGIAVHLDISSAMGKLYLLGIDADFITFDGGLFHSPGQLGGILAKEKMATAEFRDKNPSFANFMVLTSALEMAQDKIDHYAMEVGRLRDLFESKMDRLGGQVFFKEVERLPNTCVVAFENIHAEVLLQHLKKQGLLATTGKGRLSDVLEACQIDPHLSHCAMSFALSDETTQEEIERAASIIEAELISLRAKTSTPPFSSEDARLKNMRVCNGKAGLKEEGASVGLSALIDEEDGVIADCKFEAFGPPALMDAAAAAAELMLRKNYMQAKRISADLIEAKMSSPDGSYVNLLIDAIDHLTDQCMDIPIEDFYYAPPEMEEGERQVYPNWENLTDAQKKIIIAEVIDKDIRPYVELDAGGVEVVKVEENRVTIAYSGNCTSCFSATGATLDAIGNILRRKIFPDLMVIPDMSLLQQ